MRARREARAGAERTRAAMERTYWLEDRGLYASRPSTRPRRPRRPSRVPRASAGNSGSTRSRRDAHRRGHGAAGGAAVVAALAPTGATARLTRSGSGAIATDWGARILSNRSSLYDPLLVPLRVGVAAVHRLDLDGGLAVRPSARRLPGAARRRRDLTYDGALGYVTELLSGDFNTAFGRSSHHQVWSEAMVITPMSGGCSAST